MIQLLFESNYKIKFDIIFLCSLKVKILMFCFLWRDVLREVYYCKLYLKFLKYVCGI